MEIDRGLCQYLREVHGTHPNFELIEGDALESIPQQKSLPSMVFGNLPYNISTPLMMAIFLHHGTLPEQITLMLQKEMALRLMALPRTKEYNAVSVITQLLYHVKIIKNVPPSAFYPQPDVDSCIVTLTQKPSSLSSEQRCALYAFVKTAFMHRRKKLSSFTEIQRAERAEELSPDEWRELYESMC
jgi:16S rRNA (adenine1518-N6/adenine1519-N6)-dimethyltransferase